MLTIIILCVLSGILLAHLLDSTIKAAVLVGCILGILWLGRGITFEALTDPGARAMWHGEAPAHRVELRPQFYGRGERI